MRCLTLAVVFLISACASNGDPSHVYRNNQLEAPQLDRFPHCRSYGCVKTDYLGLNTSQTDALKLIFADNKNSIQERENIRHAVAYLEQTVGAMTGTNADIGGTYVRLGHMQQDCVDESLNTTTYLILLDQLDLMIYHTPNALTSRMPIISGRLGPHRTAVIKNMETGIKYAVDSWFHDNGEKPEIVALDTWRWGWHPET